METEQTPPLHVFKERGKGKSLPGVRNAGTPPRLPLAFPTASVETWEGACQIKVIFQWSPVLLSPRFPLWTLSHAFHSGKSLGGAACLPLAHWLTSVCWVCCPSQGCACGWVQSGATAGVKNRSSERWLFFNGMTRPHFMAICGPGRESWDWLDLPPHFEVILKWNDLDLNVKAIFTTLPCLHTLNKKKKEKGSGKACAITFHKWNHHLVIACYLRTRGEIQE